MIGHLERHRRWGDSFAFGSNSAQTYNSLHDAPDRGRYGPGRFGPETPYHPYPGYRQWQESLQRRLHHVPWAKWERRSAGAHMVQAARYISELQRVRRHDSGDERKLEGRNCARGTRTRLLAHYAGFR